MDHLAFYSIIITLYGLVGHMISYFKLYGLVVHIIFYFRLYGLMVGWLIDLNVPVSNLSVMLGRSHRFLGITSTFWGVNVPCSRTQHGLTRVGSNPRPLDPESEALTTRPPRSPVWTNGLVDILYQFVWTSRPLVV